MTRPRLRVVNLAKRYGSLSALEEMTFALAPGEVIGLVGRRGSGKSTLLHLLAGVAQPSAGEIFLDERPVNFASPRQSQQCGIQIVHQKPRLVERLDVTHNIFLGREISWPLGARVPDWGQMTRRAAGVLADLDMPPTLLREKVSHLSDEQRQAVAIARALCRPARVILLDDPLAALSFHRQEKLLEWIKALARQGVSLIIASDNLKHLFAVTDRILVLYEGRRAADRRTADSTAREIVELTVGAASHDQVTPVIWALESYHAAQQQAEELRRAQATLRESLEARDSLNRQLVERLRDQVAALDQLNLALQAAQRRLLTEREEERKALARELHDQVIQDLLSFNYRLEEAESSERAAARREDLAAIRGGIRQVVSDLRQLCSDLRPPTIDSHGLAAAIRSHAQEWADRNGVALTLEIDPRLGRLPEAIELSVFRIVQEGLNNIRKHAAATQVGFCLRRTPQASLLVRLSDDGRGLAEPINLAALSASKHFGLLGISERVALLGGTIQIESPPGSGVILQVEIPSPYPSV
jgi:signal transduction histidine kinase